MLLDLYRFEVNLQVNVIARNREEAITKAKLLLVRSLADEVLNPKWLGRGELIEE